MRSHKILGHIADVRLKVEGDSLEELFTAALEGMTDIIKNKICNADEFPVEEKIEVKSSNATNLLIDFLSEILTHSHIDHNVFCKIEFEELTENSLKANIQGIKVDGFDEDIKAVTYHEANVVKNEKGNYETVIVFDI